MTFGFLVHYNIKKLNLYTEWKMSLYWFCWHGLFCHWSCKSTCLVMPSNTPKCCTCKYVYLHIHSRRKYWTLLLFILMMTHFKKKFIVRSITIELVCFFCCFSTFTASLWKHKELLYLVFMSMKPLNC